MSGILTGDSAKALDAVLNGTDPAKELESNPDDHGVEIVVDDGFGNSVPEKFNSALDAHLDGLGILDPSSDKDTGSPSRDDSSKLEADGQPDDGQVQNSTSEDIESLTVTDDKGRRQIDVDFGDRDKIKKYVRMAHGMRKFQAERDSLGKQLGSTKEELTKVQGNWDSIEKAYQDRGIQGLVELLDGPEAYKSFEQDILARGELRRNASPEELEVLESRELAERSRRDMERMRREQEDFRRGIEEEREQAETRALESRIHPAFGKYRFSGKLGSAEDEHMFDDMLWSAAMKKLEPLEEQGLEITREAVDKAFSSTATAIRRRIRSHAEKRVSKTVEHKKQQAAETAEKHTMKGISNNSKAEEASELLRKGNLSGLLRGWGRYGDIFK